MGVDPSDALDPDLLEFRLLEFQALEWIDYVKHQPSLDSAAGGWDGDAHSTSGTPMIRGTREEFIAPALAVVGWDRPAPTEG
jgi:hypothetical protein